VNITSRLALPVTLIDIRAGVSRSTSGGVSCIAVTTAFRPCRNLRGCNSYDSEDDEIRYHGRKSAAKPRNSIQQKIDCIQKLKQLHLKTTKVSHVKPVPPDKTHS
jgi:hypothetical protein